jgi:hypothetical protein
MYFIIRCDTTNIIIGRLILKTHKNLPSNARFLLRLGSTKVSTFECVREAKKCLYGLVIVWYTSTQNRNHTNRCKMIQKRRPKIAEIVF